MEFPVEMPVGCQADISAKERTHVQRFMRPASIHIIARAVCEREQSIDVSRSQLKSGNARQPLAPEIVNEVRNEALASMSSALANMCVGCPRRITSSPVS